MSSICCASRRKEENKCGVGIILEVSTDGSLVVAGIVHGSPAEASSCIAVGDVLYEVDGINLYKASYAAAIGAILGAPGTTVHLGFKRGLRYESDPVFYVFLARMRLEGAGRVEYVKPVRG